MITTVKIGPIVYQVTEVESLQDTREDGSVRWLNGQILYNDETIKVESKNSHRQQACCLLHEASHAMLYQGGLDDIDEKVSINLGYSLYALIRDNPDLIKFVQEGE